VLQFASPSFDVAAEEIFPTWLTGAAVVVQAAPTADSFDEFLRMIARKRVTVLNLPAPFWHEWVAALDRSHAAPPGTLRLLSPASDRVSPEKVEVWRQLTRGVVRWLTAYGATETTITTTLYEPGELCPPASIPIGRPIANTQIYVLDRALQPVPIAVAGELYIGGEALARGYLNRPDVTAERFIPDPFSATPNARLYRTGDLARFRPDGNLEHLGRADDQVKIRGYRIEPREIEAALRQHPDIRDCVVITREDVPSDKRLVAYVLPTPLSVTQRVPGSQLTQSDNDAQNNRQQTLARERSEGTDNGRLANEVRALLKGKLPNYMVPSAIVVLDAFPLSSNGKLDRKALPAPDHDAPGEEHTFVAPRTPVEQRLAAIWSQVLKRTTIGIHDDFFALGGHSLLAAHIIHQVSITFKAKLSILHLFQASTIAELALVVEEHRDAKSEAHQMEGKTVDDDHDTRIVW
jgi:aspartate racemase